MEIVYNNPYYIIAVSMCMYVCMCNVKSAIFSMIQLFRLSEKTKLFLRKALIIVFTVMENNSLTKMKRWRNCYIENRGKRVYFIACARINLFHSSYWII